MTDRASEAVPTPPDALEAPSLPLQRLCDWCAGPLEDRKSVAKFCSDKCRAAAFDHAHPRLNRPGTVPVQAILLSPPPLVLRSIDCPDKRKAKKLVKACLTILAVLQNYPEWTCSITVLRAVGGWRTSARIGELRAAGHVILGPKPCPSAGIWETIPPGADGQDRYRLVVAEKPRLEGVE